MKIAVCDDDSQELITHVGKTVPIPRLLYRKVREAYTAYILILDIAKSAREKEVLQG